MEEDQGWRRKSCLDWGTQKHKQVSPPWVLQTTCQPGPLGLPIAQAGALGRLSACSAGLGGGAAELSDLLTERCTQTLSFVSTGKAAQHRSWLASRC